MDEAHTLGSLPSDQLASRHFSPAQVALLAANGLGRKWHKQTLLDRPNALGAVTQRLPLPVKLARGFTCVCLILTVANGKSQICVFPI